MDSISVDADSGVSRINRTPSQPARKSGDKATPASEDAAKLTDVSSLAAKAATSSPDIRPEVVERGKALVADPNWPGDNVLDGLAEKLLENEDFRS
tara:strand:+ start:400 stop:687 length:288 start_codon:yes stop_codon:yes gene_type:complete